MKKVLDFLEKQKIKYVHYEHPPFFTCEDSNTHGFPKNGAHCKNLFIKDRKSKKFFLYIIPSYKKAALKNLEKFLDCKLKFANQQDLQKYLGVSPGSVSFFGLLNDKENIVKVLIDEEIYDANFVNFHPNDNSHTLEIKKKNFHKLLKIIKQKWELFHSI